MKGSNNDLVFIHIIIIDHQMIYGMGWSADGQLGLGQTVDCNVPKALPSLGSPIKKLAGSTDFTLALTGEYFLFIKCVYVSHTHTFFTCICRSADGRLWTWGNSEYGQGMTGAKVDRVS